MIVRSYQTPHQVRVVPLPAVNGSVKSVPRQPDYIHIRPSPVAGPMVPMKLRVVPSIGEIQRATADYYGLALKDMESARRSIEIARPRMFAMYLAAALTNASLVVVGRSFGGRDHSTVINAIRRSEQQLASEAETHIALRSICASIARATERRDWAFRRGR